jgi:hypothetical protein
MAFAQKTFKLNSGYEIPAIGLGTWVRKIIYRPSRGEGKDSG